MTEIVYSRGWVADAERRAYSNPRFYTRPRDGVTKVFLVGEWPQIEADYKALGVPVERLDVAPVSSGSDVAQGAPSPSSGLVGGLSDPERAEVEIPEDWQAMKWFALRGLAQKFSAEPVLNKDGAVAAVEAELARRAEAAAVTEAGE